MSMRDVSVAILGAGGGCTWGRDGGCILRRDLRVIKVGGKRRQGQGTKRNVEYNNMEMRTDGGGAMDAGAMYAGAMRTGRLNT